MSYPAGRRKGETSRENMYDPRWWRCSIGQFHQAHWWLLPLSCWLQKDGVSGICLQSPAKQMHLEYLLPYYKASLSYSCLRVVANNFSSLSCAALPWGFCQSVLLQKRNDAEGIIMGKEKKVSSTSKQPKIIVLRRLFSVRESKDIFLQSRLVKNNFFKRVIVSEFHNSSFKNGFKNPVLSLNGMASVQSNK